MAAHRILPSTKTSRHRVKAIIVWAKTHQRLIGLWMFILGFLLVTFPTVYKIIVSSRITTQPGTLTRIIEKTLGSVNANNPIHIDQKLLGTIEPSQPPLRVLIPSQKIDLSIVEARVVNGLWEISETTASHGIGSANPGETGNTVVFAHARDGLFGPLRNITVNQEIYILTKDRWYRYRVSETKLVDPNQIETIAPTKDETLTLFTCSGFLDTKRLIVVAKPSRP